MAFALFPMIILVFFLGVRMQAADTAQAVPGAGMAGYSVSLARVRAQQLATFSAACMQAAGIQPGVISPSITVTMPSGAVVPTGAVCMTTANGSGRNVFAYMPDGAGLASAAYTSTYNNYEWWRVGSTLGAAVNVATAAASPVPTQIPKGSLVSWVQIGS